MYISINLSIPFWKYMPGKDSLWPSILLNNQPLDAALESEAGRSQAICVQISV